MSLWTWLFGSKEKKGVLEPESLRFVKNLCEKHKLHSTTERWCIGYLYVFEFYFPDGIRIKVEYNKVRREWDMEIWSSQSSSFLFYHDCLSPKPWQTINYLIDRFGLAAKVDAALEKKRGQESKNAEVERQIKEKYL